MLRATWPLVGAIALGGCIARNFHTSTRLATVYGTDDRLQPWDPGVSPLARQGVPAIVALVKKKRLLREEGRWKLEAETYGPLFGLCPEERFFEEPLGAYCSAFLVAPDQVLTAGHCMEEARDCERTALVLDYVQGPTASPMSFSEAQVFGCKRILTSGPDGLDFSLLELDRPVTDRPPLALEPAFRSEAGAPLLALGFPSGLPMKVVTGAVRPSQIAYNDDFFLASLDTATGNSGSAVLDGSNGKVVGILVGGDEDFVTTEAGCKTVKRCADMGCRGEKILGVSAIVPYLR